MLIVANSLRELTDNIVYLQTNCNHQDYPTEFQTYDEGWDSLRQSIDRMISRIGAHRAEQLRSMIERAKEHYDRGYEKGGSRPGDPGFEEVKLGSLLLQDVEQVVRGKPPFAYPEHLYSWPR
jgi:hypothetical protein